MFAKERELMETLLTCGIIRTRKVSFGWHSACFTSAEAIQAWMNRRLICTLDEGIKEGQCLLERGHIAALKTGEEFGNSTALFHVTGSIPLTREKASERRISDIKEDVKLVQMLIESGLVKDRVHRMRYRYQQCFIGSDAVELWLEKGIAESKLEAIEMGRRMVRNGMIRHVTNEHHFENQRLFYYVAFLEDSANGKQRKGKFPIAKLVPIREELDEENVSQRFWTDEEDDGRPSANGPLKGLRDSLRGSFRGSFRMGPKPTAREPPTEFAYEEIGGGSIPFMAIAKAH